MNTRTTPAQQAAGFTILEVLIAVLVLTIGIIGIFGMQLTSTISNQRAYERRMATELAETVLERIKRDSIEWTTTTYPDASTWLVTGAANMAPAPYEGSGTAPDESAALAAAWTYRTNSGVTPLFNDLGLPGGGNTVAESKNQRYCVAYRLTPLVAGSVLRVEVRVTFPKNTEGEVALSGNCNALAQRTLTVPMEQLFDEVVVTGVVQQNGLQASPVLPPSSASGI